MAILIILLLAGCAPVLFNPQAVRQLAPDVPAIPKQTQKQAAQEIITGQCPALNAVVDSCLLTRDQARILLK